MTPPSGQSSERANRLEKESIAVLGLVLSYNFVNGDTGVGGHMILCCHDTRFAALACG